MKRLINIQGTNGSGKSTLARSYIKHYGLTETEIQIKTAGKVIVQTDNDRTRYVLGKYSGGQCGGCDRIKKPTGIVLETLLSLVRMRNTEEILFEGLLLSGNQLFAKKCLKIAESAGYEFLLIFLDRGAETCINAVAERNGGKPFDTKRVVDKYRSCERIAKALAEQGATVKQVVPDLYSKDEVFKALYE